MKKSIIVILLFLSLFFVGCKKNDDEISSKDKYYYPILNNSFENQLDQKIDQEWDYYNYDSNISQIDESSEGNKSIECCAVVDGYISIWQVIPIENKEYAEKFNNQYLLQKELLGNGFDKFPEINDDVNFSIDLKVSSELKFDDPSLIKLQVKVENKRKVPTIIAESNLSSINYDEWFTLSTIPVSNEGLIPDDAVLIVVSIMADLPEGSKIYFDNAQCYSTKKSTISDQDQDKDQDNDYFDSIGNLIDIEDNSFENGTSMFKVNGLTPKYEDVGYYGNRSLIVEKGQKASYSTSFKNTNIKNETLCVGVYVYINNEENDNASASIILKGKINNEMVSLASAETTISNKWIYLKTPFINPSYISSQITNLEIQLISVNCVCYFDYVQIGDYQKVNGNPEKFAILVYQPWFQCNNNNNWGNWKYDSTIAGGRQYNPANIIEIDGVERRDIASVYYPLIGVYDSNDEEVLNYHVDLIKAMNFDCIQVNYYGSLSSASYQLDVFDKLVKICEKKNLKISILYEPKVHLNGWIPHSSREESVNGILSDLTEFVNKYKTSKALLRYNGKFAIEAFGLNILKGQEWTFIKNNLEKNTQESIFLMGDGISSNDYTNIDSMFQWSLYTTNLENANSEECENYCLNINKKISEWVEVNGYTKQGVGIVYPGFDDTPVRSWSNQPNGKIRKIERTGLDFYTDSWNAFLSLKDFNWVIVATFNDWTEGTVVEPSINHGHDIAYKTYQEISKFKGFNELEEISYLEEITNNYLNNRITKYK